MPIGKIILAVPGELMRIDQGRSRMRSSFYFPGDPAGEMTEMTKRLIRALGPHLANPSPSGQPFGLTLMSLAGPSFGFATRLKEILPNLRIFSLENLTARGDDIGACEADMEIVLDQMAIMRRNGTEYSDLMIILNPRTIVPLLSCLSGSCEQFPNASHGEAIIINEKNHSPIIVSHQDT